MLVRALLAAMNVNLGIWDKLTRLVIFLLFVAFFLIVAVWYLPLIRQNERMRTQILKFDAQIQKQEETARQLKSSIEALRYDPKAVERLAREQLGYTKPGETMIRFEAATTNAPLRPF
ncbi:MAG TPA: septum formation initiator family protein [Candidatus Binatia bacterium]|jgi:cell division protein FtsB|nr:septum formation initiator family protein [Candidatus Binatia bacterium]